jgi:ubiquinone biosynthesis monooxygenase Coq6
MAGFQTTGWDYKQHALICTVEVETENQTAWQRFLPSGPLALLPMGKKFCNIVWSTTPEKAAELKGMTEGDFIKSVNNALEHDYGQHPQSQFSEIINSSFKWLTGELMPSTSEPFQSPPRIIGLSTARMSFPLSLMHARDYASNRVVLVGDAAHTVHPLAGQGVNLGFGDAAALARILNEGILTGSDIGEVCVLTFNTLRYVFALSMLFKIMYVTIKKNTLCSCHPGWHTAVHSAMHFNHWTQVSTMVV